MFKRVWIYALPVAALGLAVWVQWLAPEPDVPMRAPVARPPGLPALAEVRQQGMAARLTSADAAVVAALRQQFGADLGNPRTQLRLLDKLLSYLKQRYPGDWQRHLYAMLRALDPMLADQLYRQAQRQLAYSDWQEQEQRRLAQLDSRSRRQELWAKRNEVFGADAEVIWAQVRKSDQVEQVLESLAEQPAVPLASKRAQYVDTVRHAWVEEPGFVAAHRQELVERFLALEAVQSDLHALSPPARAQELTALRQGLGMDEGALDRWRELDARRDQRWAVGQQYESERHAVSQRLQGEALQQELQTVRSRLFGAEADTIRNEEQAGYYRFRQRQQYGVN